MYLCTQSMAGCRAGTGTAERAGSGSAKSKGSRESTEIICPTIQVPALGCCMHCAFYIRTSLTIHDDVSIHISSRQYMLTRFMWNVSYW